MAHPTAFSLIEIVVSMAVAAVALFPVISYFSVLQMSGEVEELETEAITVASNIMEGLIAPTLPFDAIKPAGDGNPRTDVLAKAYGRVPQAGFADPKWERLISDEISGGDRIKRSRKGAALRVYFFAGIYFDRPNRPDPRVGADNGTLVPDAQNELTFTYLPGPFGDRPASEIYRIDPVVASVVNNRKVLPAAPATIKGVADFFTCPYRLKAFEKTSATPSGFIERSQGDPWHYTDPQNYFKIPGWPTSPLASGYRVRDPAAGLDSRPELQGRLYEVASRRGPTQPTIGFHPVTADQGQFIGPDKGSLMKLVVGVKYRAYGFKLNQPSVPTDREFWLVSLKARLTD